MGRTVLDWYGRLAVDKPTADMIAMLIYNDGYACKVLAQRDGTYHIRVKVTDGHSTLRTAYDYRAFCLKDA